jgi:hypothetical protein
MQKICILSHIRFDRQFMKDLIMIFYTCDYFLSVFLTFLTCSDPAKSPNISKDQNFTQFDLTMWGIHQYINTKV